jgi:hypothetical protein
MQPSTETVRSRRDFLRPTNIKAKVETTAPTVQRAD